MKELDKHIANYFNWFNEVQCSSDFIRSKSAPRMTTQRSYQSKESSVNYTNYMLAHKNAQLYSKQTILKEVQSKTKC